MSVSPATLPPVLLHSEAELARAALATPLLSRAVRLARWAGPETRVGAGGELVDAQLPAAAAELGLSADAVEGADAAAYASEAWRVAVDTGLIDVTDAEEEGADGTVTQGEDLALLSEGSPQDVLGIWLGALDTVYADATVPDMENLLDVLEENGQVDFDELGWDPQAEADFLDGVLGNLYLLTVGDAAGGESPVPLPALAASMIVPDDMGEPTDDILEQVSDAMMKLDDQFRLFEPLGLVEYQPVDEALMADIDDETDRPGPAPVDDEDVSRYGMVRLTPLGLYGVRARMLEAGVDAPAVGDLADKGADALLDGTSGFPQHAAQAEIEQWLGRHEPLVAARELLAAARGADEGAPLRRLRCQQALSLVGDEAEPALRDVLDDPQLGGLARVWLAEHGATDVPAPSEELIFWLTIDTLAAQLSVEGNSDELQGLVEGLAQQHSGFFATAWRVEHPATADVLEAMGRLHPDKKVAKEARKAAFKARNL
ncbi:hypothetical protein DEJ49_07835 [Streptomyces venezuelae]|uniref:Uncharacterized protein n=1 Tax=Streptomyces venezuelae TaxID=54571 RepID=A0A5P2CHZ8_STRVZ|nr:hypothetical protein [Streptomyces venezuelae]QES40921.1 hypothetical protein DEJ49_07835 [Streptomyces venezuelae]